MPATILTLLDVYAMNRPVADTDGSRLPAATPFADVRDATCERPVPRSHAITRLPGTASPDGGWNVKATTLPSAEMDGSRACPPPANPGGSGRRIVRPRWRSST